MAAKFGSLSLSEDGKQLLLDGEPIPDGLIIVTKCGEDAEPIPARVVYSEQDGWYLYREEFIGHPYLDSLAVPTDFKMIAVISRKQHERKSKW